MKLMKNLLELGGEIDTSGNELQTYTIRCPLILKQLLDIIRTFTFKRIGKESNQPLLAS